MSYKQLRAIKEAEDSTFSPVIDVRSPQVSKKIKLKKKLKQPLYPSTRVSPKNYNPVYSSLQLTQYNNHLKQELNLLKNQQKSKSKILKDQYDSISKFRYNKSKTNLGVSESSYKSVNYHQQVFGSKIEQTQSQRRDNFTSLNTTSRNQHFNGGLSSHRVAEAAPSVSLNFPKIKYPKKKQKPVIQSFDHLDMNNSFLLKKIGDTKYHFKYSELTNDQSASRTQFPQIFDFRSPQHTFTHMSRDLSSTSVLSDDKKLLRDQSFIIGAHNSNSKFFPPIKNYGQNSKTLRRDHSLHQASKDSLKRQISFLKIWEDYEKVTLQRETISKRRALITDICENWGRYPEFQKHLTYNIIMEMDIYQLEEVIEQLKINIKMDYAARMIQGAFLTYKLRQKFMKTFRKRTAAALKIQSQYKIFRFRKLQDSIVHNKVHTAGSTIQKYLKGLIISKKYEEVYVNLRLTKNLDFFQNQRKQLEISAQIKIAYYWRKKLARKRKRKAAQLAKQQTSSRYGVTSKVKPYLDGKIKAGQVGSQSSSKQLVGRTQKRMSKPDAAKTRNSIVSGNSSVSKTSDKNKSSDFKQFENSRQSGAGLRSVADPADQDDIVIINTQIEEQERNFQTPKLSSGSARFGENKIISPKKLQRSESGIRSPQLSSNHDTSSQGTKKKSVKFEEQPEINVEKVDEQTLPEQVHQPLNLTSGFSAIAEQDEDMQSLGSPGVKLRGLPSSENILRNTLQMTGEIGGNKMLNLVVENQKQTTQGEEPKSPRATSARGKKKKHTSLTKSKSPSKLAALTPIPESPVVMLVQEQDPPKEDDQEEKNIFNTPLHDDND